MSFRAFWKLEFILVLALLIFYFALRLPNLTLQPIFADEAIYIRWAQIMRSEPTLRFVSMQDGKTPLFMWAMIPFLKIFEDPLFAGRLLSVLSGFFMAAGVFFIAYKHINLRVAVWAVFLMVITPYIVFFDRMALVDSMLAAFSIWSLALCLWLVQKPRLDLAMFLGYVLGASMLVKTPGFFNVLVTPFAALVFRKKSSPGSFLKTLGFFGISLFISMVIYNLLRLGPGFVNLSSRNQDYVHSPLRLLEYPLDPFMPHVRDFLEWVPGFLSYPIFAFILGGVGIALINFRKNRIGAAILVWALIPMLVQAALLKTFTARYVLSGIAPMLILAAWAVDVLSQVVKKRANLYLVNGILAVGISILPLIFDYNLLTDPFKVPLARNEREGYFEEWTAGYGFKQIAAFLIDKSRERSVVVGTEGSFGTLPDGLWIYLDKTPNISVIGGGPTISANLREAAKENLTYFVANKSRFPWTFEGTEKIMEFPKAKGVKKEQNAILLFQVFPER